MTIIKYVVCIINRISRKVRHGIRKNERRDTGKAHEARCRQTGRA